MDHHCPWVPDQPDVSKMVLLCGPRNRRAGTYTAHLLRSGEGMSSHAEDARSFARAQRRALRSFPSEAYIRYRLTNEDLEVSRTWIDEASNGRVSMTISPGFSTA